MAIFRKPRIRYSHRLCSRDLRYRFTTAKTQPATNITVTATARYRSCSGVTAPPTCSYAELNRPSRTLSAIGPFGIALGPVPHLGSIEITTRLDVSRMRGNGGIADSEETLGNDFSHFKAVKTLLPYLCENSSHRVLYLASPERSKERHLYLCRHEKEIPACGMYFAIQGEAVEPLDDAPFP